MSETALPQEMSADAPNKDRRLDLRAPEDCEREGLQEEIKLVGMPGVNIITSKEGPFELGFKAPFQDILLPLFALSL